ncbi:hypothetical protein ACH4Q6_29715 [Streptomyces lydicus]|uniref:hypothetical protein n=1 Tax=Streptomyces lydicus TaxID=47763 RepID=UPI0037A68368
MSTASVDSVSVMRGCEAPPAEVLKLPVHADVGEPDPFIGLRGGERAVELSHCRYIDIAGG